MFLILSTSCLAQNFALQVSLALKYEYLWLCYNKIEDREVFNDEEPLYDSSLFVEREVKRKIEHFTKERKMSEEKPSYSQVDVWKKDAPVH